MTKSVLSLLFFILPLVITSAVNDTKDTSMSNEHKGSPKVLSNKKNMERNSNFECEGPWRLPRNMLPINYDVTLRIDPDDRTFNGSVIIDLQCVKDTNQISFHAHTLAIGATSLYRKTESGIGEIIPISNMTLDNQYQMVHLELESLLEKGYYVLNISDFEGKVRNDTTGLFLRTYKTKDSNNNISSTRQLIASQLAGTYARMVFPCFDEPNIKSTFVVHIERPSAYKSFSNMPLKTSIPRPQDRVLDTFEKTVVLPTYLLAFLVGDFSRYTRSEFNTTGILVPEEDLDKVDLAYQQAVNALRELESYTKIPYPVSKVDHAAIPDFPTEAMENWGLILYAKDYIVDDWKIDTLTKQAGLTLVTHELAHQWFGNMVTLEWWSYLWMNEGFATLFQYFISNKITPVRQLMDQFLLYHYQEALSVDARTKNSSVAMTTRLCTPEEMEDAFSPISYDKGASVLRMFQSVIGEDEFQGVLRLYLQRRLMQNVRPADLFQVFDEISSKLNERPLPENVTFTDFATDWTEQVGYPVITVTRDYLSSSVFVKQERFFDQRTAELSVKNRDNRWWVPLTWTSASSSHPASTRPQDWLYDDKTVRVYAGNEDWVLFNTDATGFYRVNYDGRNWDLLRKQLERSFEAISVPNRMQLVNDAFTLGFAHRLNLGTALNMTRYLRDEKDPVVWSSAVKQFNILYKLVASTSAYPKLETYLQKLMRKIYRRVKLDISADEPYMNKILRLHVAPTACLFGLDICLIDAHFELSQYLANAKLKGEKSAAEGLHQDIRSAVLYGGIQVAESSVFEEVRSLAINTTMQSDLKDLYLASLSYTKDVNLLTWHLEDIFDNNTNLSAEEASGAVMSVLQNQRSLYTGYTFVKNNVNKINHFYNCETMYTENLIKEIANNVQTNTLYDEVRQWILSSNGDELGNKTMLLLHLESRKPEIEWSSESLQQVSDWLNGPEMILPEPIVMSLGQKSAAVSLLSIVFSLLLTFHDNFVK